jgi:hypothetical protein
VSFLFLIGDWMMILKRFFAFLLLCSVFALPSTGITASRQENALVSLGRTKGTYSLTHSGPIINVSDYTGETDQERIQNALNDVPQDGAVVFVPAGVWQACNLTAKSGTTIMGENGTVLERPADTTVPFVTFENVTDFAVTSLTFDGQNVTDATGILVVNGSNFSISDSVFEDIASNAVHIVGETENFVVERNFFINSSQASVLIFGSPGIREISDFLVVNNSLIGCLGNGKIGVAFAANGTVADNYVVGSTYGIATRCDSDIAIRNNRIENCSSFGIYLGTQPADAGTFDIDITDNYVAGCNVGIARYYGTGSVVNVTVANNTMVYNSQLDIFADFPGSFLNNTLTSRQSVKLAVVPRDFVGNVNLNGTPIIPPDVDDDGRVNMRDLGIVCRLYGTTQASENWNPRADVIQDGVIDMRDVGFCAKCFMSVS